MQAEAVYFAPFRLDPRAGRLYRGQATVPLRPKTYAVLRYLVGRAGQLVRKEDLFDAVWPDLAVSDAVLKVSVRELREALGDDARSPRYIETAHRTGYRFIAEVAGSTVPVYLTSFVGRDGVLAELGRLLPLTRLLTLTGAGGSGKTRLAARFAETVAAAFDDGVAWVDLVALAEPSLVAQSVASALNVQEHPGRPLLEALATVLRQKAMLLVLDNCEHLVDSCGWLAGSLLRACPRLKVLATSREPLSVAGETIWPLPPLSLPDVRRPLDAAEMARSEAVRLFVERARAVQPDFMPNETNAAAVSRVCGRLDGLPLAIELAAPRLKVLTVQELAARLDDGFRLSIGGNRSAVPRHQTLQATMDWSHALLPAQERALLARVAVFAGGWTLRAVEHVGNGRGGDRAGILDLLSRLVDKSLVVAQEQSTGTRYRLLETVRQYALEKLAASGDRVAAERDHAEYYLALAEELGPLVNTIRRADALAELEAEHDNLRTALRWFASCGNTAAELRLSHALVFFWFHRGYWSEGRRWYADALQRSHADGRTVARGRALAGRGWLASLMGSHQEALEALEESVSIHRELGDRFDLAHALRFLVFPVGPVDSARARGMAEESVALYRDGGAPFDVAITLSQVGTAAYLQGDYDAARAAYEESAERSRAIGDLWALAVPLAKLGLTLFRQGDLERAMSCLKESLEVQRDRSQRWFLSLSIEGLARVLAARGRHRRAARLLGAGESLREAIGAVVFPFYLPDQDRAIAALRDALGDGVLRELWHEGRTMTTDQAIVYSLADDEDDETGTLG